LMQINAIMHRDLQDPPGIVIARLCA
jgi:hypothetical protein